MVRWCEGTIRVEAEAEANNGDKAIDCPGPGGRRADCSALGGEATRVVESSTCVCGDASPSDQSK